MRVIRHRAPHYLLLKPKNVTVAYFVLMALLPVHQYNITNPVAQVSLG